MKRLALIATLIAGPAMAGEDEVALVNQVLNHTPCSKLIEIVIEFGPWTQSERRLRTAAYGLIVGRALGPAADVYNLYHNIKKEVARVEAGCTDHPDRTWMSVLLDRSLD